MDGSGTIIVSTEQLNKETHLQLTTKSNNIMM